MPLRFFKRGWSAVRKVGTISSLIAGLLIITGVFCMVYALVCKGWLRTFELNAYDDLIRLRRQLTPVAAQPLNSVITLITVDEGELRKFGYPLSDKVLTEALGVMVKSEARVIGIDMFRDQPVLCNDKTSSPLPEFLTQHPNIIFPVKLDNDGQVAVPPPKALQGKFRQMGFVDVVTDADGIVRRGLLSILIDNDKTLLSFPLRLTLAYLKGTGHSPPRLPALQANTGAYVDADVRGYQFLLDYRTPLLINNADSAVLFSQYSLTQLLNNHVNSASLKDKIILFGITAGTVKDTFLTPMNSTTGIRGLELHALNIDQLLRASFYGHQPIATWSDLQELLWILGWTLLGCIVGKYLGNPVHFLAIMLGGLLILFATVVIAFLQGWWLIFIAPAVAWLLSGTLMMAYQVMQERRLKSQINNLLELQISPEIATNILRHQDQIFAEGKLRSLEMTATVMFTDIQGFTGIAETLNSETVIDWLNEYLGEMALCVAEHHGVVFRFIGDAVLAAFGAPIAHGETEIPQDAKNAVHCALTMQQRLMTLNHHWQAQGRPAIGMRIGIHTGALRVGSVGYRKRFEYTIIGDTVNTAARLESFEKQREAPDNAQQPCRILVSSATAGYLDGEFALTEIGDVALTGMKKNIKVFRVLGATG